MSNAILDAHLSSLSKLTKDSRVFVALQGVKPAVGDSKGAGTNSQNHKITNLQYSNMKIQQNLCSISAFGKVH